MLQPSSSEFVLNTFLKSMNNKTVEPSPGDSNDKLIVSSFTSDNISSL